MLKDKSRIKFLLLPVVIIVFFVVGIRYKNEIELSASSKNVHAFYTDKLQKTYSEVYLIELSEDELLNNKNTIIFKGEIKKIKNIDVSFNGLKNDMAIAIISVFDVYQGDIKKGDEIKILLPCSINNGIFIEDTDVISNMKEGMTGIFMPVIYDESSFMEINNETLYFTDLALYGLSDGERFVFLDNGDNLIYDRNSYPSLNYVQTLDEIGLYITEYIK